MTNPGFRVTLGLCLLLSVARAQTTSSNMLNAAMGGSVVRFTAAQTNIAGLIDPTKRNPLPATEGKFPQEIVFTFRNDAEALVERVVIKPDPKTDKANWPKRV